MVARILIAIDGSPCSDRVVAEGLESARALDAAVTFAVCAACCSVPSPTSSFAAPPARIWWCAAPPMTPSSPCLPREE